MLLQGLGAIDDPGAGCLSLSAQNDGTRFSAEETRMIEVARDNGKRFATIRLAVMAKYDERPYRRICSRDMHNIVQSTGPLKYG